MCKHASPGMHGDMCLHCDRCLYVNYQLIRISWSILSPSPSMGLLEHGWLLFPSLVPIPGHHHAVLLQNKAVMGKEKRQRSRTPLGEHNETW